MLRTAKPSMEQLRRILKGHRAPWREHLSGFPIGREPTESEICWAFKEVPETTFVAITRVTVAWVNNAALRCFYGEQSPITYVDSDPDANPDNFQGTVQISWDPLRIPVFVGMRIQFTKNINKEMDYVNGMGAIVEGAKSAGILVTTDTGYKVIVYPWTDEWHNVFLPMRLGYASTLLKMQGATIKHMTMYLDFPNIEAAGYVALSRVKHDKDWRFMGSMSVHHFTPAKYIAA